MTLFRLFLAFVQVGLFAFGGGYAAVPLIEDQAVNIYGWLTAEEFSDLVIIAEMTPGPIALNAATFVGTRVAGISGALIATVGVILPSLVIVSVLTYFYRKYRALTAVKKVLASLRPVVVALIASAGLKILLQALFPEDIYRLKELDILSLLLYAGTLFAIKKLKWGPIPSMFLCGAVTLAIGLLKDFVF